MKEGAAAAEAAAAARQEELAARLAAAETELRAAREGATADVAQQAQRIAELEALVWLSPPYISCPMA